MEENITKEQEVIQNLNQRLAFVINQGILPEKAFSELNQKYALEVQNIKDLYTEELTLLRTRLNDTAEDQVLAQRECKVLNDKCILLQKKYKDLYTKYRSAETDKELIESKIIVLQEKLRQKAVAIELEDAGSNLEKTKKKLAEETAAKVSLINEIQTLKEEIHFKENLHSKITLLEQEKKAREQIIDIKERENFHLRNSLQNFQAYHSVSIEPELNTYRRLVEIGENCLHTPMEAPGRFDDKHKSNTTSYDFIEIVDVDANGAFIKIKNTRNDATNISGLRLIQINEYEEEMIFKFKKGTIIQPASTITIWSNESGKVPRVPTDIVMKKNNWYVGNEVKTTLISSNFLEISVWSIPSQEGITGKNILEKMENDFKTELAKVKETLKTEYYEKLQLWENEKKSNELILQSKEDEINHLKKTLETYKSLYPDVCIQPEIEMYRYLLEVGETSWMSSSVNDEKNKFAVGSDYIKIIDVHPGGTFVKIQNFGNNLINISGWRVIQINEEEEENTYKFRRETFIEPGSVITVFGCDFGNLVTVPHDIVLKNRNWFSGKEIKTVLVDRTFLEISHFTVTKSSVDKGKRD